MLTELDLFVPIPMSEAETELRAWIKLNNASLKDQSPPEVGYMAIICGFDPTVVYGVLSNFNSVMQGRQVDSLARFEQYRFEQTIKLVDEMKAKLAYVRELDLMPLWREVTYLQTNDRKMLKRSR